MALGWRYPSAKIRNLAAVLLAVAIGNPTPVTAAVDEDVVLVFPQDFSATWFAHTYGAGKLDGRIHRGEDLHAPKGAAVYAAADGVIVRMSKGPRSGYYLVVQHAGDWQTWYMHLNNDTPGTDNGRGGEAGAFAAGLSVGSFVVAGQLIGFVGDSGNAEGTESHTHFELHHGGRTVNPYPYLVTARGVAERLALQAAVQNYLEQSGEV